MIAFQDVSKSYEIRGGRKAVLKDVSFSIATGEKVGIMGRNGAGKSTTIKLLSGAELPTSGRILREMSVSWPLAYGGAFQSALTGRDNLKFICRVYGKRHEDCIDYVDGFAEIGRYLDEPVRHYSSGMRARLAFAISMIIDFDCFLIDEVVSVGDSRFHAKCHVELFEKRAHHSFVIVSHDPGYVKEHCETVYILEDGQLRKFSSPDEAIDFYLEAGRL